MCGGQKLKKKLEWEARQAERELKRKAKELRRAEQAVAEAAGGGAGAPAAPVDDHAALSPLAAAASDVPAGRPYTSTAA